MDHPPFLSNCTTEAVASAAAAIKAGALVAFPTETVYGLGADACSSDAVSRIYEVKGRPAEHPLIVHIASMNEMAKWSVDISTYAISLARNFWPGPMTLIVKRSPMALDFITGGQESVGLRVPNHVVALALLDACAKIGVVGIAAPSANRFGQVSPTTASAVAEELGAYLSPVDLILDGGPSLVGIESTIIDCTGDIPRILRPGAITVEMIEASTGLCSNKVISERVASDLDAGAHNEIRVSGSLESHYAPIAKVILCEVPTAGQGFIALSVQPTPAGVIRLASPINSQEYARDLYAALRKADALGLREVVAMQPVGVGIEVAIRDRLQRAANGR